MNYTVPESCTRKPSGGQIIDNIKIDNFNKVSSCSSLPILPTRNVKLAFTKSDVKPRLDTTFYGYGYATLRYGYGYATVFLESTEVTTVVTVFLFFNISLVFRPNLMIRTAVESPRKELSNGVLIIENDLEMTEIRSLRTPVR